MTSPERLRQLLSLIDLTSLNDAKDDDVSALCDKARTPYGAVAAVCSWPCFTQQMVEALSGTDIPVAVVINFPSGDGDVAAVREEARQAVADGADELDLVWPYRACLAGDRETAKRVVSETKAVAGAAKLKVILESGAFDDLDELAEASRDAMAAGADMLKTSTGKIAQGASIDAAQVMLSEIMTADTTVGFKASGGIRSVVDAESYLALAEEIMGPDWPSPATFRIGASRLLDQILDQLA